MSVIGYSSLEDAWGVKPQAQRSRRAKKKMALMSQQTPPEARAGSPGVAPPDMGDRICDLYDAKFRRKRRTRGAEYDPWDSMASIHHPFSSISAASEGMAGGAEFADNDEDLEAFEGSETPEKNETKTAPQKQIHQNTKPVRREPGRQHENHDLFIYVFSGVLLLFVLEQFIQVGLHIGVRNVDYDIN